MNPLLKKEIRLVLPAWLAVLLLELCLPWVGQDQDSALHAAPFFFFFGMVLLAVDSFGREFSLGTFSSLMAQPVERGEIWRAKISVLLGAAALIFAAYFLSCDLRVHQALADVNSIWHVNPRLINATFGQAMVASVAVMLVALTGGLWTALLLRQVSAAFWITFLAPAALLMLIALGMSLFFKSAPDEVLDAILYGVAGLYVVAAFWLARRLMFRAEDAGWTGGVVSFASWRYFEGQETFAVSRRQPRPWTALVKKELQLHSISLFGAAALLGLHLVVFFFRAFYSNSHVNSSMALVTDSFWMLWLVIPLVIGCTTVAEERKLGVADGQSCLPVSRRRQYVIKLLVVGVLGGLLGGVMPFLLESGAGALGFAGGMFRLFNVGSVGLFSGLVWFQIGMLALAAGLALLGFFASTLAKNFLQALSIAILLIVGGTVAGSGIASLTQARLMFFQLLALPSLLFLFFGPPLLVVAVVWLGYRNFLSYHDAGRLWRRNLAGILGAILFGYAVSAVIYDRVWELAAAEPAHGLARLSLADPPKFENETFYHNFQLRLPGGRVWCDSLEDRSWNNDWNSFWDRLYMAARNPMPVSAGPRAFMAGSDWISTAVSRVIVPVNTGYKYIVGIQADGTLWVSNEARPGVWPGASLARVGSDSHWRQVVASFNGYFVLLKTDGTLWRWGTNNLNWQKRGIHRPTIRNCQPQRIGADSHWQELFTEWGRCFARKDDGTVSGVEFSDLADPGKLVRTPDFDSIVPSAFSGLAYVGKDGSLWVGRHYNEGVLWWEGKGYLQAGRETNWVATATTINRLLALKRDGTLWQWDLTFTKSAEAALARPPTRLDGHSDWVALASTWDAAISVAADGSLWLWPGKLSEDPQLTLLRVSRQPTQFGNIFAGN